MVEINTPTSCPGYSPSSSNTAKLPNKGWTTSYKIMIGTFSLFIIYCGIGAFLNKRKDPEATICESIPNREFWLSLPSHIKDGAAYVCELIGDLIDRVRGNSY